MNKIYRFLSIMLICAVSINSTFVFPAALVYGENASTSVETQALTGSGTESQDVTSSDSNSESDSQNTTQSDNTGSANSEEDTALSNTDTATSSSSSNSDTESGTSDSGATNPEDTVSGSATTTELPKASEEITDPSLTSIEEILMIAKTDGTKAATLLNQYTDEEVFLTGVKEVLTYYYEKDLAQQLHKFEDTIDERAASLVLEFQEGNENRNEADENGYVAGEVLVVYKDGTTKTEIQDTVEAVEGETEEITDTINADATSVVELPLNETVEGAIDTLEKDADVAYAQPNYLYKNMTYSTQSVGNDTYDIYDYNSSRYYFDKINTKGAWDILKNYSNTKVKVAVLDTGVNISHLDLQTNLNKSLSKNVVGSTITPLTGDLSGHGTHVAGIIGATYNNSRGIAGIASGYSNSIVDLYSINVFYAYGNGVSSDTSEIVKGLTQAVSSGADVISMSLGIQADMNYYDTTLETAIKSTYNSGVVLVAAAGNGDKYSNYNGYESTYYPCYPGAYNEVIGVMATDDYSSTSSAKSTYYSNYGSAYDISAPGHEIYSTKGSTYDYDSGTSMATPVVSAVAAMVLYVNPELTPAQVKSILYSTTTDLYTSGYDIYTGYGNVNAASAVKKAAGYISLDKSAITMSVGQTAALAVTYNAGTTRTFTSSNSNVATINAVGGIIAKNPGVVAITVTNNKGVTASCKVTVTLAATTLKTSGTAYNKIKLTWNAVNGATSYIVYRSTKKSSGYSKITTTTSTTYTDTKRTLGKKYYYKIVAQKPYGFTVYKSTSAVVSGTSKLATPIKITAKSSSSKAIKLSWKKVTGASRYLIYRASSKNGRYSRINTVTSLSYKDLVSRSKKTYYYKIYAQKKVNGTWYKSSALKVNVKSK